MSVLTGAGGKTLAMPGNGEALGLGSGPHCRIIRTPQGYVLEALIEAYVNGQKVRQHVLREGDVIQSGGERFTFSAGGGAATGRVQTQTAKTTTAHKTGTQRVPTQAAPATGRVQTQTASVKTQTQGASKTATGKVPTQTQAARSAGPPAAPPATGQHKTGSGTHKTATGTHQTGSGTHKTGSGTHKTATGTHATQKTTQRATGRATGRATTGRLSHRTAHVPEKPKISPKHVALAVGVLVGLGAIGGIIFVVRSGMDDPVAIKAELTAKLDEYNKIPLEDVAKRLELCQSVIANLKYKMYSLAMYNQFVKAEGPLKDALEKKRLADTDVRPFLAKYEDAKKSAEWGSATLEQVQPLYDEARSLHDKHGNSVHADKLAEIKIELNKKLSDMGGDSEVTAFVKCQLDARKHAREGDFAAAFTRVREHGAKYKETTDMQVQQKLKKFREELSRAGDDHIKDLSKESQKLVQDGKKDDAKKLLEAARKGVEGTQWQEKLEQLIKEIK